MVEGKGATCIKPIDKASVHRICSGQVILDLATAVKELVENSLDAGATSIEILLKDYGADSFEVADNGSGVSPENYQALTLKYHTSKISEFGDLQSLASFGFRGEALSSLCALGNLTVVTRTKNEAMATQLHFDHTGSIISQESKARPVGTTVSVSKLFESLPVRYKEFNKNIRREYSKLIAILHAYALVAKNVRLVCTHLTGKTRTVILKTQGTSSVKDNIITVFGTKVANCLEPINVTVGNDCRIEAFISKPGSGSGRASGDRQFYYVNNRPVELPRVAKMLNELYRSFNSLQFPMAILNFILPPTAYDVNVTPDKRKVFLHAENELLIALRDSLESVYAPEKYTFSVKKHECKSLEKEIPVLREHPDFETQRSPDDDPTLHTVCTDDDSKIDADNDSYYLSKPGRGITDEELNNSTIGVSTNMRATLDSFQCKTPVVSGCNDRAFKFELSKERKISSVHIQDEAQSKLTGYVADTRRPREDEFLITEQPVLKKFLISPHPTESNVDTKKTQSIPDEARTLCASWVDDDSKIGAERDSCYVSEAGKGNASEELDNYSCGVSTNVVAALDSFQCKTPVASSCKDRDLKFESLRKRQTSNALMNVVQSKLTGFVTNTKIQREGKSLISEQPVLKKCLISPHPAEINLDTRTCQISDQRKGVLSKVIVPDDDNISCGDNPDIMLTDDQSSNKVEFKALVPAKRCLDANQSFNSSPSNVQSVKQVVDTEVSICADEMVPDVDDSTIVTAKGNSDEMTSNLDEIKLNADESPSNEPSSAVAFDLKKVRSKFQRSLRSHRDCFNTRKLVRQKRKFDAASIGKGSGATHESGKEEALAAATSELERTFNKADFRNMRVLGQFNLGFILAKLNNDIFIIDQHASDEKYNFERLSKTVVLNRQPLLRPLPLDLSASEEVIVLTHLEAFRKNGFDFVEDADGLPGRRLCLTAVPFSKNTTFGTHDVQELVSLLADEPIFEGSNYGTTSISQHEHGDESQEMCLSSIRTFIRPSRVRAMLASRACRSSIMIGHALSKKQMQKVLSHLAELESPWNCPHGRPTMRHLVDLSSIKKAAV